LYVCAVINQVCDGRASEQIVDYESGNHVGPETAERNIEIITQIMNGEYQPAEILP
jgi:hypothetical protein